MPYNNVLRVSVHQNHHREPFLQKFKNISTLVTCEYYILYMLPMYLCFYISVNKVPDVGTDEPKHVAYYCMAFECSVWRYILFLFQQGRAQL